VKTLLLAVLVACGGRQSTPSHPSAGSGAGADTGSGPPSERECAELIAHALDLAAAERRAAKPDEALTDDERRALDGETRADLGPGCRSLTRARYACAMAVTNLQAIDRCASGER
jgi:hypothetical protein